MGGCESGTSVPEEPSVKYHPCCIKVLTPKLRGTVPVWQFNWGGSLLKGNEGAQRYPRSGRKSDCECKGIWVPDCEEDIPSRQEIGT